ncbi:MAG: hypothetical protein IJR85_07720 [Synergistaceae bacterium]|nr:hypothetical protein [Synergistaceae bacterium]
MKRSYLWLFVVLMFWAAVSAGGCGGSSSSNFSGNTSGDVSPNPDTNSEDYGGNNSGYIPLSSVNGKTFRIVKCEASETPDASIALSQQLTLKENSYSDNSGVRLGSTSDSLFWIDSASNEERRNEPFTADFLDGQG